MMYRWKPDMIRFMRAACEFGDYNERLTQQMLPYLSGREHVCDAGCGLGYLARALAPHVRQVTAVDANENALQGLRESNNAANLSIKCCDIFADTPETPYDTMVFCFFGSLAEILEIAKRQCAGRVFVFHRNYQNHRFSTGSYESGSDGRLHAGDHLKVLQIPFAQKPLELEFGQPFTSFDDARLFFSTYQRGDIAVDDAYLQEHLVETGRDDFPLYLPHTRKVGFLTFDASDIP